MIINKKSDHAYIHISFLETEDFGKVACKGMVLVNNKDAIVLETTVDNDSSAELIGFNQNELDADIKAVIAHHFHIDSIGGLEAFHSRAIHSDANKKTIDLCIKKRL